MQPDSSARWWRRVSRHSFTRFAAFGLLGLGIDVTLLWLLLRFVLTDRAVAVTIAFAVTYGVNFTLNRFFSFAAHAPVSGQLARFVPQVAADYLLTLASVEALAGLGLTIVVARILAGGTNAALNYLAYRFWTFGRRSDDRPTAGIAGP